VSFFAAGLSLFNLWVYSPLMKVNLLYLSLLLLLVTGCKKSSNTPVSPPLQPASFSLSTLTVNNISSGFTYINVSLTPSVQLNFSASLTGQSVQKAVSFNTGTGTAITYSTSLKNGDSALIIHPSSPLQPFTKYTLSISTALQSKDSGHLQSAISISITTSIDSTDKFPRISDDSLLTLVQKQTFKYFWSFGHPVSGLARERNTSGDVVTTGGTGFGIMAMIVAANRGFITRSEALARIGTIANFYKNNCTAYHGAYSHWINGATGATVPFSPQDDGADLVETAYLMQGLLCAKQYFNTADADETSLRSTINQLWDAVEWTWFQQNNQNVLYWHWSPNFGWTINLPIHGWNEALMVYALAASSRTHAITKEVYDSGWAQNGAIKNGKQFYGISLPLGEDYGGPLFFAHYSFLGINPKDLSDAYATDYWQQNAAHTGINYSYCVANPKGYTGYNSDCWGLTASDEQNGYNAHSPTNDNGTISPTAAISSLPYDTAKCMAALRFFYYKLGDKLWGDYGFKDAFNLTNLWFADSYLAIDQGPEIVMIENARSRLLWKLFMSCPEVKTGMKGLGFQGPNLK